MTHLVCGFNLHRDKVFEVQQQPPRNHSTPSGFLLHHCHLFTYYSSFRPYLMSSKALSYPSPLALLYLSIMKRFIYVLLFVNKGKHLHISSMTSETTISKVPIPPGRYIDSHIYVFLCEFRLVDCSKNAVIPHSLAYQSLNLFLHLASTIRCNHHLCTGWLDRAQLR